MSSSDTKKFLSANVRTTVDVPTASGIYISLVNFVKQGKTLDQQALEKASDVLENFRPGGRASLKSFQIISSLAPNDKGLTIGFRTSVLDLLAAKNVKLTESVMQFLDATIASADAWTKYGFIYDNFLNDLFPALNPTNPPMNTEPITKSLVGILSTLVPNATCTGMRNMNLVVEEELLGVRHLVFENVLLPSREFLVQTLQIRHRNPDSAAGMALVKLCQKLIEIAPFLPELDDFVRKHQINSAVNASMELIETDAHVLQFLDGVNATMAEWKKPGREFREAERAAKRLLIEEGLQDDIEQREMTEKTGRGGQSIVETSKHLLKTFGGNQK
ncbi:hypothetical protein BLNAU_18030 [Blattamonas nauphoetae]|uniref:Uncharacterized protein n=1 Tax=Blattamonas nauphoetae TaxID=2049346 RepID=A0ABQ9X606_9EUKA|nr:hypothetical protein BLNAU_18030 [Blattamonas nauphoetae]